MVERQAEITGRSGFTLVEALVATVLSAFVIGMVLSVMMAQGTYFNDVSSRAQLQESVRSLADQLREELQGVTRGGVVTARSDELVFRVPVAMGVVCVAGGGKGGGKGGGGGASTAVYLPFPGGGVDAGRISGYALRSLGPDEEWSYHDALLEVEAGDATLSCEDVGADTDGAEADFRILSGFTPAQGGNPSDGDLVALVSEVEFRFDDSLLVPGRLALLRREGDGDLVEFASGFLEGSTGFQYRRQGETAFQDQVTGQGNLQDIVEIRLQALAESRDLRRADGPLDYEWNLRVPLRNVP